MEEDEAMPALYCENELSMPLLDHVLSVHGSMLRISMTKSEIMDRLVTCSYTFNLCLVLGLSLLGHEIILKSFSVVYLCNLPAQVY